MSQVGASERSHTLFVNFGGRYPDHIFTGVIFNRNLQAFPDARSWEGKVLRIRGKVQLYREKPEIIQTAPDQVTVVK